MKEKILFFDTETTGLDWGVDSVYQLAGIIYVDGEEKARFDLRFQPKLIENFPDDYVTPTGGHTKADLQSYKPYMKAFNEDFLPILNKYVDRYSKLDKFHLAGYNCQAFDSNFLRRLFQRCGNEFYGSYFYPATLDVMVLAANNLRRVRHKLPNFKLQTVAEHYGFSAPPEQYHDALTDILATKYIWDMVEYS